MIPWFCPGRYGVQRGQEGGYLPKIYVNTFLSQIWSSANISSQSCAATAHGGYAPEKGFSIPKILLIPCPRSGTFFSLNLKIFLKAFQFGLKSAHLTDRLTFLNICLLNLCHAILYTIVLGFSLQLTFLHVNNAASTHISMPVTFNLSTSFAGGVNARYLKLHNVITQTKIDWKQQMERTLTSMDFCKILALYPARFVSLAAILRTGGSGLWLTCTHVGGL